MGKQYLGHLPETDPLRNYLKFDIQPQLTGFRDRVDYRVFRLNGSNDVYLYEERYTGVQMIGKFFLSRNEVDPDTASRRLDREFRNLAMMRGFGFTGGGPHYVARPLGRNEWLNRLLITEFCQGEMLSNVLERAIVNRDSGLLYRKLTALAWFLATFHNRTAGEDRVDFNASTAYGDSLVQRLLEQTVIGWEDACELYWLRDRWRDEEKMWLDRQVWVHGDATPDNFLFGDDLSVITFDLERVRRADRVYDTGRIAGELQHVFLLATGNKYAAEPFIGHFLWEYACHFPDRERTFETTCRRVPFYMGMTLLRIARNNWLGWEYRRRLIYEAKLCLRRWTP